MDNNVNLNEVSRISAGTAFKGTIITTGDIRIDGQFDGTLSSKGRLVVGESATVNGDVICQNVDFSGKMGKGTIYVADTLSLKGGCSVDGDLRYKKLQVELDAKINPGICLCGSGMGYIRLTVTVQVECYRCTQSVTVVVVIPELGSLEAHNGKRIGNVVL